jgi:hypothetical protein
MAKNTKRKGIPVLLIIGFIAISIFWWLFGGLMLLRYLLGALIFATVTVSLIKTLNKTWGKSRVFK